MQHLSEYPATECQVPIKKNQRSVVAPTVAIRPYGIGVKQTPSFDGSALDKSVIKHLVHNNSSANARKIPLNHHLQIASISQTDSSCWHETLQVEQQICRSKVLNPVHPGQWSSSSAVTYLIIQYARSICHNFLTKV